MTWYIFPTKKEDRLIMLIFISVLLLIRVCVRPFLTNEYWILFFDIGGPIVTGYLFFLSLILAFKHYSIKIKELQKELESLKR